MWLERVVASALAALVRLLVGIQLSIRKKAVLQAVNPDLGSLFVGD